MLQKQPININFSQGLDLKPDPKQVQAGKFLALRNSVFDKAGGLVKRDGYPIIAQLPNANQTTLTTLNDNLLATGSNLYAFSSSTNQWLDKGKVQPIQLSTQSLVRNTTSQTAPDTAVSSTGLVCLVYVDNSVAYYQVSDNITGQQIVARTALPSTATNPRVFLLDRYFIITFMATVGGTPHFQYIAVPISTPASPLSATDISTLVASISTGYDGMVVNNKLYLAWGGSSTTVKVNSINSALAIGTPASIASSTASLMSVTSDTTNATLWISFWDSGSTNGWAAAFDYNLNVLLAKTQIITTTVINELTSMANSGVLTAYYEVSNNYAYVATRSDYISENTVTQAGVVGSPSVIVRSVGLASKAFIHTDGVTYMMIVYGGVNEPTYFIMDSLGNIYAKIAYANGGGYLSSQVLPNVSYNNGTYSIPYLIKDFLTTVNKNTNNASGTPVNAIYTQVGVNLLNFQININNQYSSEIANTLHLTGGILWQYDGVKPVENGFHLYPEDILITTATSGGSITANTYYYSFTYEWTDNQGNLHRSAPSIPVKQVTTTSVSTNTIKVPTLRLTYKTSPNPVRIVGYRWSLSQQTYYQFTSVTSPVVNDTTVDYVTITDTLADSSILGNAILYTTGGVVENTAPPACTDTALFKNRLFLIDAEDQNLLWFSKQVIENTPVEMSDLLTIYVAPTSGAQGSTGVMKALSAMDDKLIIFKKDAIYYITGNGPDNTGAQNDFSDPIFITSSVGCANPNSTVLMPNGIMFQSDKGIWLLGRDLSTTYIGAPVEAYNNQIVKSALTVPGTNQVRFTLDNNVTLMYDYFYQQWGTFNNISAISSTLYQGKDTYLNTLGHVHQQTPNVYVDGSSPVLLSFTTSWISLAGIQGLERFYFMYLLGTYITPFKLNVGLAYDYNTSTSQQVLVTPDNYSPNWGGENVWGGGGPWGGPGNVFEARIFPQQQKCQTFQITIEEVYDPSYNVPAGQGLSLSGMNIVVGMKKGYRTQKASQSFG